MPYNRRNRIPGVTNRRIPGGSRLAAPRRLGGHSTRVPHIEGDSASFREYHRQQLRDSGGRFAGQWGMAWQGMEALDNALAQYVGETLDNVEQALNKLKDDMVEWAKANAPWQDDDTNDTYARGALHGAVVRESPTTYTLWIAHGAEIYYGIWLEVRWGGRYAILEKALLTYAPRVPEYVIRTQT